MSPNSDIIDSRSDRIICAKLYEGGLLSSYDILRSVIQKPFKGKSPEHELNIDLITKHAGVAFRRHILFTLTTIALSLLGFIFSIFYSGSVLTFNNNTFLLFLHHNAFLLFLFWIFSVSAICIFLLKPIFDRKIAFDHFSRENYDHRYNLNKSPENEYLNRFCKWIIKNEAETEKQNVIVFGDYFPFLGSGQIVDSWNFIIDTSKSQNENNCDQNQNDLSIKELYDAATTEIKEKKIPILDEYILYADGNEIEKYDFLLEDKSKPRIHLENINSFSESHMDDTLKDYRSYLQLRFHDKHRSTLLSTFLRFSKVGKNFFTECSFYVLAPVNEDIYNIDKLSRKSYFNLKVILKTIVVALIYLIGVNDIISGHDNMISVSDIIFPFLLLLFTLYPLLYILYHRIVDYITATNNLKNESSHNYGILKTFRETIASPNYKSYFSAQDVMMVKRSLEKSIIKSIADLLEEKGINSSFLRDEITSIINYGIMQSGGTISNSSIASGDRSTITQALRQRDQ